MTSTVDRTFVISFKAVPNRPKYAEISDFIVQKLEFPLTEIKHLQITNSRVYVGTESPETAQNMVQNHNMKHQLELDGKLYTIPLSMEDGTIEVRVHDLRPKITNQQLVQRMKEFGQISSARDELWKDFFPGVPNGVRILRMKLIKPIPSYITVDAVMTLVTYMGQVATCKHCNRNVHYTQTCSEYAKSLKPSVNERLTAADVVKNSGAYQDFIEVKRSRRSSTRFTGPDKNKQLHRSRSNVSVAGSEISISSVEGTNLVPSMPVEQSPSDFATPISLESPMETSSSSSPLFHGFPNLEPPSNKRKQHNAQRTQPSASNVNRPVSPGYTDKKDADNRPTRSETRTETRAGLRSRSPSRTTK